MARFSQSTFLGASARPRALARTASDFRPTLGQSGELLRAVLAECDGKKTSRELADHLAARGLVPRERAERIVREAVALLSEKGYLAR